MESRLSCGPRQDHQDQRPGFAERERLRPRARLVAANPMYLSLTIVYNRRKPRRGTSRPTERAAESSPGSVGLAVLPISESKPRVDSRVGKSGWRQLMPLGFQVVSRAVQPAAGYRGSERFSVALSPYHHQPLIEQSTELEPSAFKCTHSRRAGDSLRIRLVRLRRGRF